MEEKKILYLVVAVVDVVVVVCGYKFKAKPMVLHLGGASCTVCTIGPMAAPLARGGLAGWESVVPVEKPESQLRAQARRSQGWGSLGWRRAFGPWLLERAARAHVLPWSA